MSMGRRVSSKKHYYTFTCTTLETSLRNFLYRYFLGLSLHRAPVRYFAEGFENIVLKNLDPKWIE